MDDSKILESAHAILKGSPYHELRKIRCIMVSGTLLLTGKVSSFYLKQLAFHTLEGKLGDLPIKTTLLEVKYP